MNAFLHCLDSAIRKEHGDSIPTNLSADRLLIPSLSLAIGSQEIRGPENQVHIHTSIEFGTQTLEACIVAAQPNGHEQCANRWMIQVLPLFVSLCSMREQLGATHIDERNSPIAGAHGFLSPIWTIGDKSTDLSEAPFFAGLPTPHPETNGPLILTKAVLLATEGRWSLVNEINGHEASFEVDPLNFSAPVPGKFSVSSMFGLYFFPASFPKVAETESGD
jgi:hypothetical protein